AAGAGALVGCSAPAGSGGELPRAGMREATLRYVMHQDSSEIPTYEGLAQRFTQKLPKIRVAVEPIPWEDYPAKITAMLAGGTPPDCCYQASRRVIGFAANGQTLDLNALLTSSSALKDGDSRPSGIEVPASQHRARGGCWRGSRRAAPRGGLTVSAQPAAPQV
ncbi:MAG: extracellular solute-binding protein, partial [Chloroflexota bacterium]|nr:extracellular solute-binding protein [Chloroflexota bacterium]